MNWWQVILQIIYEGLGVVKKAIPPDEIRIDRHEEKKELRAQDFSQEKLNDDFNYCKSRPEMDLWDYMREVHPKMSMSEMATHHKLLEARVTAYRKDVVKWRGWRWRKHRDWLEINGK